MQATRHDGWLGVLLALPALLLAGCGSEPAPASAEIVRPVKMFVFGEGGGEREYSYPGRVHANQTVEVAFEVTGKLEKLPVTKGQLVRRGELLAQLDQRDYRNELQQAKAAFQEALATRDRYREAAKTKAVARTEVDQAEARARIAEAEVRIKQKALDDTTLRADFDGVVSDRFYDNFQNVVAKQPVLLLQDLSKLEIRIDIPERDVVAGGDEVGDLHAVFDAVPAREFELAPKEFVTEADPVTQTYKVVLVMPNPPDAELLPGMTASVRWVPPALSQDGVRTIPLAALLGQPGSGTWVFVIDPETGTVRRREVRAGAIVSGDRVEVLEGLEPGERIAAAGAHHLDDGMRVRPYGS